MITRRKSLALLENKSSAIVPHCRFVIPRWQSSLFRKLNTLPFKTTNLDQFYSEKWENRDNNAANKRTTLKLMLETFGDLWIQVCHFKCSLMAANDRNKQVERLKWLQIKSCGSERHQVIPVSQPKRLNSKKCHKCFVYSCIYGYICRCNVQIKTKRRVPKKKK